MSVTLNFSSGSAKVIDSVRHTNSFDASPGVGIGCQVPMNSPSNGRADIDTRTPLLCLLPGPTPLSEKPGDHEFWALSEYFRGFILSPVWSEGNEAERCQPRSRFGAFDYYTKCTLGYFAPLRVLVNLMFYINKGRSLHKATPYVAIVAYGPFTTAWAGYVLKKLTGAKLIVEFPGNPQNSFLLNAARPRFVDRVKTWIARVTAPVAVKMADHVRLLYKEQLDQVTHVEPAKTSAFHYFTTIKGIVPSEQCDNYILASGGPWYRKGVDVLIKAFQQISDEFPNIELRVIGFSHDREHYERLAAGHPRIKLCGPMPRTEAIDQIRRCRVFACPSRSEGFPRVIIEAMASERPVVASAVDGIPTYVQDNVNGLLVQSEDVSGFAEKLSLLLGDLELQMRLGKQARQDALRALTEDHYAESYRDMVHLTVTARQKH